MAELKGPVLFTGSLGSIRAYYNKTLKRYIVSTKGGSTREMIMENAAFARQRENMNEFKICAIWAKHLRRSLLAISHLFQGYYFSEIMAMAKSIQKHDTVNVRGIRSIESSLDAMLLTGLNFNREHPFEQSLTQSPEIVLSTDKRTVTLRLMNFKSRLRINWPTRFESYRIALCTAQLPDFVWDDLKQEYLPVAPKMEKLSVATFSDWKHVSSDAEDIVLTATFAEPALVVALGVEVSMAEGDASSMNRPGFGTMKIVECFV